MILTSQTNNIKVNGLTYKSQFISKEQQKQLIKNILQQQWNTSLKRRTQHYGYEYLYDRKNEIKQTKKIPQWAIQVKKRVEKFVNEKFLEEMKQEKNEQIKATNKNIILDQLIINEYNPGQGINPHIDNPNLFSSPIVSLSLGSDCIMNFDNQKVSPQQTVQKLLKRRSIIVLDKEARYEWKHSIPARKKDNGKVRNVRWSLTWRIMKDRQKIDGKNIQNMGTKKIKTDE